MSASQTIRPIGPDEFDDFVRVIHHGFGGEPEPEETREIERKLLEFDRTLAAFDGARPVASAAAYSFQMTVPGGRPVPTAGVTWVAVLPTHRRRGLLTSLMRRQLDDIRADGNEPIAALWASEASIYGRFGYGLANTTLSFSVPRGYNRLHRVPGAEGLEVRLVEPEDSLKPAHAIYDHDRARRPGMPALANDDWVAARIDFPPDRRDGGSPLRAVLIEDSQGDVRAYARYSTKSTWERSGPEGTATVRELHALDQAAAARAWQYLLNLDLSTKTTAFNRPNDDPLLHLLLDPRRAQPEWGDALYVRLIDIGAALRARTYSAPVECVIGVEDAFCDWNTGRWRLRANDDGVRCDQTDDSPDLSMDVRELGACYLGGTSMFALADAGLIAVHNSDALPTLSTGLRHEPQPWCPFVF